MTDFFAQRPPVDDALMCRCGRPRGEHDRDDAGGHPDNSCNIFEALCPACGGVWRPWRGSILRSHARCHFPIEVQDHNGLESEAALGQDYGVTSGVIRATVHEVRKRREAA